MMKPTQLPCGTDADRVDHEHVRPDAGVRVDHHTMERVEIN